LSRSFGPLQIGRRLFGKRTSTASKQNKERAAYAALSEGDRFLECGRSDDPRINCDSRYLRKRFTPNITKPLASSVIVAGSGTVGAYDLTVATPPSWNCVLPVVHPCALVTTANR